MARKKVSDNLEEDEPGLDISSLIDVCFLLLIYFLVTTTIQPREQDLKMTLPAAAPSSEPPELAPMFIKVDKSGSIYINTGAEQEALDSDANVRKLPQLKGRLDSYANAARAGGKEPIVQIWADGEAAQQRVVDVLNCLASAKVNSVTFTDLVDTP
ncbi:biopolymer transporter ExbD [Verrucomicrobiaceae bacterium N1E253]|uniref:Biopolymer transporter ExbD n=1 Tax=Oceaniferula marina TaxID=2748318 RepID=A0A851GS89_9BACT|nr:biopolymer transporter ExbD [Oceaniferula marina]NWK57104.1 biopolymer transporter ExbD [Oceaniferula marina]